MKKVNWNSYKFHCSTLPALLSNARGGDGLSETAKARLREIWIEEKFGRKKLLETKYTTKGIIVESDSLELVSKLHKKSLFKNKKTLQNDWIVGTPDVVIPKLIDIKSSWDIFTFFGVDEKKATGDYYWQLLGYMWLTGKKRAELWYALSNTPEELTYGEEYNLFPENFTFDDLSSRTRTKKFVFTYEPTDVEKIKARLTLCREYLGVLR